MKAAFYVLSILVLLWGYQVWEHVPNWIHLLVIGNLVLGLVLFGLHLYQWGMRASLTED